MTDDYIKREDALKGLEDSDIGFCDDEPIQTRNSALKIIQNIPAADVAPVVRGRWVHGEYGPYCSNCDGYPPTRKRPGHPGDTEFDYTNFCPNCGAKMEVQDEV